MEPWKDSLRVIMKGHDERKHWYLCFPDFDPVLSGPDIADPLKRGMKTKMETKNK